MGLARIELGGVPVLYRNPIARIEVAGVNVIYASQPPWAIDFACTITITADLTVGLPEFPDWLGDWLIPVEETIHFSNEILQSSNRTEQRISLRGGYSRRTFDVRERLDRSLWTRFAAILHNWAKSAWPLPIWTESQRCVGEADIAEESGGVTVIYLDTTKSNFIAGERAAVFQPGNYETILIAEVHDSYIILVGDLRNVYNGFCWVMPCKIAYLYSSVEIENEPNQAVIHERWILRDAEQINGFSAELEYDGMTVVTKPPIVMSGSQNEDHFNDVTFHDYGTGPFDVINNSDFNEVATKIDWRINKADSWWVRQFLHANRGSQKAFLLPSFAGEMRTMSEVAADATQISIEFHDLAANLLAFGSQSYVGVYVNGDLLVRKVEDISAVGSTSETLIVNEAFGVVLPAGSHLCWVHACRLHGDSYTFVWEDREIVTIKLAVLRVEQ